jgi:hypothetical protein
LIAFSGVRQGDTVIREVNQASYIFFAPAFAGETLAEIDGARWAEAFPTGFASADGDDCGMIKAVHRKCASLLLGGTDPSTRSG